LGFKAILLVSEFKKAIAKVSLIGQEDNFMVELRAIVLQQNMRHD